MRNFEENVLSKKRPLVELRLLVVVDTKDIFVYWEKFAEFDLLFLKEFLDIVKIPRGNYCSF
jgi:hypothetical protein